MLTDSKKDTTAGEPAQTAPAPMDRSRLATTAVAAGGAAFMAVGMLWLSGVAGLPGGWAWSALVVGGAAVGAGWVVWGPRRGRMAVVTVLASAGMATGILLAAIAPLEPGRLWSAMDEVFPQATVSGVDSEGGNTICFDECPSVSRTWDAVGGTEEVQAGVAETLQARGYEVGSWAEAMGSDGMELKGHRGRVRVGVEVEERSGGVQVTVTMATSGGYS